MIEDSRFGDNLEAVTDSDLEIEILVREPDSEMEEFVMSTSHVKDEINIGAEHLISITSQRRAKMVKS